MDEKQKYIQSLFVREDSALASINKKLERQGFPLVSVPKEVGKLLYLLVKISGAQKILEVGTLGGYSTIWLARALPEMGNLTTIDCKQEHIDFAAKNIKEANVEEKVSFLRGDAVELMEQQINEGQRFDFFFIDADKGNYPVYLEKSIELANPGAIITMDNLFFHDRVLDEKDQANSPQRLRQTNQRLAEHPQLESILLPVGDGVGIARVKE